MQLRVDSRLKFLLTKTNAIRNVISVKFSVIQFRRKPHSCVRATKAMLVEEPKKKQIKKLCLLESSQLLKVHRAFYK